ncbi:MAG: hypothetical protein ACLFV7_05580 [Phycisphaerae bacterium]
MRSPNSQGIALGWWLAMGAGLVCLAVFAGGCGLFPDGPDSAAEAMMAPVESRWGYDMEDATVTLVKHLKRRETWNRARRDGLAAARWVKRTDRKLTESLLDFLAGPPQDYNDAGMSDEQLRHYFRQP